MLAETLGSLGRSQVRTPLCTLQPHDNLLLRGTYTVIPAQLRFRVFIVLVCLSADWTGAPVLPVLTVSALLRYRNIFVLVCLSADWTGALVLVCLAPLLHNQGLDLSSTCVSVRRLDRYTRTL